MGYVGAFVYVAKKASPCPGFNRGKKCTWWWSRFKEPPIPHFSFIAAPLFKLTCKDVPFVWDEECHQAVRNLKKAVTSAPVLVQPDPSRQFELEVDASAIATGTILYQRDPPVTLPSGKEKPGPQRPIGFHGQKFTATEMNYPIYDREFLAIMQGLQNWNHLLKGTTIPVLVYTDHANL